jgi:hypothetical protein
VKLAPAWWAGRWWDVSVVNRQTAHMTTGGRWEQLVGDLESQAQTWDTAERAGEISERARAEFGQVRLIDRLRPARDEQLAIHCVGGVVIQGAARRIVSDGVLVSEPGGREALIALAHVLVVLGLGRMADVPDAETVVESRIGLRNLARSIARDRSGVRVHLSNGSTLDGTLDRVGADFVEVALHPGGESRRRGAVRQLAAVPLAALVAIRRDADPG